MSCTLKPNKHLQHIEKQLIGRRLHKPQWAWLNNKLHTAPPLPCDHQKLSFSGARSNTQTRCARLCGRGRCTTSLWVSVTTMRAELSSRSVHFFVLFEQVENSFFDNYPCRATSTSTSVVWLWLRQLLKIMESGNVTSSPTSKWLYKLKWVILVFLDALAFLDIKLSLRK